MAKGAPVILSNRGHSQWDPLTRALVGPAGEHWVLYRLYREGLLAALSPPGILEADILVLDIRRQVAATIQVKTRTVGRDGGWHMQAKHEAIADPRHFYALVDLEAVPPITYIVPSPKIGQVLRESHQNWLRHPGTRGAVHRDSKFRRILPKYAYPVPGAPDGWLEEYCEGWSTIIEEATS